jgi:hypothetical protein
VRPDPGAHAATVNLATGDKEPLRPEPTGILAHETTTPVGGKTGHRAPPFVGRVAMFCSNKSYALIRSVSSFFGGVLALSHVSIHGRMSLIVLHSDCSRGGQVVPIRAGPNRIAGGLSLVVPHSAGADTRQQTQGIGLSRIQCCIGQLPPIGCQTGRSRARRLPTIGGATTVHSRSSQSALGAAVSGRLDCPHVFA